MSKESKEKPKDLWVQDLNNDKYQSYVTVSSIDPTADESTVYIGDLEKREQAYGICGECHEPGTGWKWCQPCNAKRFRENFKNWTSGDEIIDEFIQHSQLNAVYNVKYLEWIPYEKFRNIKYITKGGFGEIYSAMWPEGFIWYWDIENQKWVRFLNEVPVVLKCLDAGISGDLLDEIKSHLQIHFVNIVWCYGITQNPDTKDYMMVLRYCDDGNLRDYLNQGKDRKVNKVDCLAQIANGLLNIHNAGKVHKDLHSGNVLFDNSPFISDLGMCQPANNGNKKAIYGVLPYMAPEVLRRRKYTKASDIYSFGIIMNEFISEEIPHNNIPHDHILAVNICKGLRPNISKDTPELLVNLIKKCWDADAKNRPTAKELHQMLKKYANDQTIESSTICTTIRRNKSKSSSNEDNKSSNIQTHPLAMYTSRRLDYEDLPEPVNSLEFTPTAPMTPISEFFDAQLDLNKEDSSDENNIV